MSSSFIDSLARIIAGGQFQQLSIVDRIVSSTGLEKSRQVATKLAGQITREFCDQQSASASEIKAFLKENEWSPAKLLRGTGVSSKNGKALAGTLFDDQCFRPVSSEVRKWELPELNSILDLAELLEVSISQLDWFAATHPKNRTPFENHQYEFYLQRGTRKQRVFEIPNPRLMQLQRQLLGEIFEKIPLHSSAHGFRKGHSVKGYAAPHVGQSVVWRTDLASFFPSIPSSRIFGALRTFGYPFDVAQKLTQLTTTSLPKPIIHDLLQSCPRDATRELTLLYSSPHLPQGAPSSPAMANMICYRLDCRLQGLANKYNATYTRYADDLAFSGDIRFKKSLNSFQTTALAIVMSEGFSIRRRKSVVMNANRQQKLTGIVVNKKLNVSRAQYKTLHAILHNCIVHGPATQNRDNHTDFAAHLRGRIEWIKSLNPQRGVKLHEMYQCIDWQEFDSFG